MAKKSNNIAMPNGNTRNSNRRKKGDSSNLLPVVSDEQTGLEEEAAIVARSNKVVTNCDHLLTITPIEDMIITLRGVQVIVDRDLATLYGVGTKRMNEQVRRNLNRFPPRFRFQLTKEEVDKVVTNCEYLLSIKYSQTHPYVFTEQRVAFPRPCDAQLPVPAYRSKVVRQSHDRFLCLANTVYHIDISLKDLGKKWFSFKNMEMKTNTCWVICKIH